jgi:hypothetical protein
MLVVVVDELLVVVLGPVDVVVVDPTLDVLVLDPADVVAAEVETDVVDDVHDGPTPFSQSSLLLHAAMPIAVAQASRQSQNDGANLSIVKRHHPSRFGYSALPR